jgi:hypothetical protein
MDEPIQATDRGLEAEDDGGEPHLGDAGKGKDDDEGFIEHGIDI